MDIVNIEKKLKKINSVLEIFKEDGQLTKIEKDLLKGYIRDLYDSVCFVEEGNSIHEKKVVTPPLVSESFLFIQNAEKEDVTPVKTEKNVTNIVEDPIESKPILSEVKIAPPITHNTSQEASIQSEKVEDAESSTNITEVAHELETAIPQPEKEVKIVQEFKSISKQLIDHPELIELFADDEYTDISDKLSMNKIDQIASSIGINDRFYMINELFNGDGGMFTKVLDKLDNIGSLEGAKNIILNEVAIPMKWVENNKLVAAEDFIKLVKRRYK
jgi:hypothetical protein